METEIVRAAGVLPLDLLACQVSMVLMLQIDQDLYT